jgi:hypothetical protein
LYRQRDHLTLKLEQIQFYSVKQSMQEERQQELMTAQQQLASIEERNTGKHETS